MDGDPAGVTLQVRAPGSVDAADLVHRVPVTSAADSDDFFALAGAELDAAADRLDPAGGVLVQAVWFDATVGAGRLLLVLHHLTVDGVSWRILVPDLAGWHRKRMPSLPDTAYIEVAPDWICEVISGSTEHRDRTAKSRIYAAHGIGHLWLLDPRVQSLEVLELNNGGWLPAGFWRSDDVVSAPPFDAISFSLADLWPLDRPLGLNEDPQHLFVGDR